MAKPAHLTTWEFRHAGRRRARTWADADRYLRPIRRAETNWPGQLITLGAPNLRDQRQVVIKLSAPHPR